MGLERCFWCPRWAIMSMEDHSSRCPVIIMRPCTSCFIFICTRRDTYLIKRLGRKVPAWQQMSREFLTKRMAFSASSSCDSPSTRPPQVKQTDSPAPVIPCRLHASSSSFLATAVCWCLFIQSVDWRMNKRLKMRHVDLCKAPSGFFITGCQTFLPIGAVAHVNLPRDQMRL